MLANQFPAGLKQEIKVKVAGVEGSFEKLLSIAKFEEAKLRDIIHPSSGSKKTDDFSKNQDHDCSSRGDRGRFNRQSRYDGSQFKSSASSQHHGSVMVGHLARECLQQRGAKPVESPGQSSTASKHAHHVTSKPSTTQGRQ